MIYLDGRSQPALVMVIMLGHPYGVLVKLGCKIGIWVDSAAAGVRHCGKDEDGRRGDVAASGELKFNPRTLSLLHIELHRPDF
jgi:hypothetical protein